MSNNLNKKRKTWLPIHKQNWIGDWFDPYESYLRLPSFWWPFTIIIIGVALASWKVISDQELEWGLDSRVEQWYEWFKIPLWVLALLIPVLGLLNANHKSEQTRAQMELTRSQNNFANYYKHLEEFEKYMGRSWMPQTHIESKNERLLHSIIYGNDKGWKSSPNIKILRLAIQQNIETLMRIEDYMDQREISVFYYEFLLHVDLYITALKIELAGSVEINSSVVISSISRMVGKHNDQNVGLNVVGGEVVNIMDNLIEIYKFIDVSFGFSPQFSGVLRGSWRVLEDLKNDIPARTTPVSIGSSVDKDRLDKFVDVHKIRIFMERESLKQRLVMLQEMKE